MRRDSRASWYSRGGVARHMHQGGEVERDTKEEWWRGQGHAAGNSKMMSVRQAQGQNLPACDARWLHPPAGAKTATTTRSGGAIGCGAIGGL